MNAAALLCASPALVFDLDGTLVDTLPDLTDALNQALREHGRAPVSAELVRGSLHGGIETSVDDFADFLRLQIICTINGRATDIDPALMRPGRMLCHRIFDRLPHESAAQLAAHLGKQLPGHGSYTLAEIFADETPSPSTQRAIGFTV